MRRSLDKGFTGMLMTDLSKAFDCMVHDLLIAKLEAYGLDYNALTLIQNYPSGRKHRTRVVIDFITWSDIKIGVLQGSILGPALFNIYINDIFLFNTCTDITNYADDNTLNACDKSVELVISRLIRMLILLNKQDDNISDEFISYFSYIISDYSLNIQYHRIIQ